MRFFQAWLQDQSHLPITTVIPVEQLDIPTSDVLGRGYPDGNRGRVLVLAGRVGADERLRCIIDRDCGEHLEGEHPEALFVTDYPALESYALTPGVLEKANLLSFKGKIPEIEIIEGLTFALRELYAVRCRNPGLPKPRYDSALKRGALIDFDVKKASPAHLESEIDAYTRPDSLDVRSFAYGHDIAHLLFHAFANIFKNQLHLRDADAVEGALRSAIHAAGYYRSEPLFIQVHNWLMRPAM